MVSEGMVNISSAEVGNISTNDVELAMNVGAIVLGFRVNIDPVASDIASKNRVLAKVYSIIYELTDEVKEAIEAMQLPSEVEEDSVEATFKDGVLKVEMKPRESAKARKIQIKS